MINTHKEALCIQKLAPSPLWVMYMYATEKGGSFSGQYSISEYYIKYM